jgi:DNA-binding NarL/FixJ family response regulator
LARHFCAGHDLAGEKSGKLTGMNTTSLPITLLTVDDHPIFQQGLASALAAEPGFRLLAQAGSGAEAVSLHGRLSPDVTLVDLQMPGMCGVEAIRQIRIHAPQARIVALTMLDGDMLARRAMHAGAAGYLLKSAARKDLLETVRDVHDGRRSVTPAIARLLADTWLMQQVTRRELEVLAQVARGNSNRSTGALLGISRDTVDAHMRNILLKLNAHDRTHAVLIAMRRGILDWQPQAC